MVRRWREGEKGYTAQDGGDAGRLPDMRGDMVGCERVQGQCGEGEVEEGRVGVFGVCFEVGQSGIGGVCGVLLPRGDETEEPGSVEGRFDSAARAMLMTEGANDG